MRCVARSQPCSLARKSADRTLPTIGRRTAFAKIQARLLFPEGYPTTPLIVELWSSSLPQAFLRKLTKKAEEAAHSCTSEAVIGTGEEENDTSTSTGLAGGGKGGRAVTALRVVMHTVNHNKLLPCWKELRQSATLVSTR